MQSNPGRIAIDMANPLKKDNPTAINFIHKEFHELRASLITAIKTS